MLLFFGSPTNQLCGLGPVTSSLLTSVKWDHDTIYLAGLFWGFRWDDENNVLRMGLAEWPLNRFWLVSRLGASLQFYPQRRRTVSASRTQTYFSTVLPRALQGASQSCLNVVEKHWLTCSRLRFYVSGMQKITESSEFAVQSFSPLSQWNMYKEIKSCTKIVGNFIPRPARSLTCVLICYIWPVRRHVALSNLGFLGGIVKIHFKKQKFELTRQVPQSLAPVPAGPCDPRILGLWQKAS